MPSYKEPLPEQCPPTSAEDREWTEIYRALVAKEPDPQHFLYKAAMGESAPFGTDPCRFASCSMMTTHRQAKKMLQYPKFANGAVAKLNIPQGSGQSLKKKQHVDFWAYSDFDFLTHVTEVDDAA